MRCGAKAWWSMTNSKALRGNGRRWMEARSKPPWRKRPSAPTRRTGEKNGSKIHAQVDARGIPLSLYITGANINDITALEKLLRSRVIFQKPSGEEIEENLCADKGYVGGGEIIALHGYVPHIRPRGEEAQLIVRDPTFKPRRWVVEAFHSWLKRNRKIHTRYEKKILSFAGLVALGAALIIFTKISAAI